jgi:hypothetical protein
MVIVWAVTSVVFRVVVLPYEVVRPYSTSESLSRSVVQLIVACEDVTPDAVTAQITGSILVTLTSVTGDGIFCAAMTDAALRTSANATVERILEDMMAL